MHSEEKKYILANLGSKTPEQIASELGIKERKVRKIIRIEASKIPEPANRKEYQHIVPEYIPSRKIVVLASILLIVVIGFAVYANSLGGKFLFDDENLVTSNPLVKGYSNAILRVFASDRMLFAGEKSAFYRPLQLVTYALDYRIWRLDPFGYHLTNIILHILVSLSIYWLASILFKNNTLSFLAALLFVVHPIHTVVVSYISTRAESLYLLFTLSCLIFYIKYSNTGVMLYCIATIFSYSLALFSKENSLILPALILLYHYSFRVKIRPLGFMSILAMALAYLVARMTLLRHMVSDVAYTGTFLDRLPGFFDAVFTYLRLMVLPFDLHIEYGMPIFTFTEPKVIAGIIIICVLIFCVYRTAKTNKLAFFSLSWFLITLMPVSNLYPLNAYMSENWMYLPSIGLFIILAEYINRLYQNDRFRIFVIACVIFLLSFYSYLTFRQNYTWEEPIAFYERTLKYAPNSPRIYHNLGLEYNRRGDKDRAIEMYKKAIRLNLNPAESYNNLGSLYSKIGKTEDAILMYKQSIELDPNSAQTYNNLGLTYYNMGKKDEAVAMYKKAIELYPGFAEAYNNLGITYNDAKDFEKAEAMYKKALELNPDYPEVYNNLGKKYEELGREEEALELYGKAIKLNPSYLVAYNNLAALYRKMGRETDAVSVYRKAIELNADSAEAYNSLGSVFYKMGERDKAIQMYKKALTLDPDYASAYNNLGLAYGSAGRYEDAVESYKKVIELSPKGYEAYNNLANIYDDTGRKEEAVAMYKKAIEINPSYIIAYKNLASTYNSMGNTEGALAMYNEAIALSPGYSEAYGGLGSVYYKNGDREKAMMMYKKAIEIDPKYAAAYYDLGLIYYETEMYEEAINMYIKAIENKPDYVDAYNNLGAAYVLSGKFDDAAKVFKITLELDPGRADARRNLELITKGKKEETPSSDKP